MQWKVVIDTETREKNQRYEWSSAEIIDIASQLIGWPIEINNKKLESLAKSRSKCFHSPVKEASSENYIALIIHLSIIKYKMKKRRKKVRHQMTSSATLRNDKRERERKKTNDLTLKIQHSSTSFRFYALRTHFPASFRFLLLLLLLFTIKISFRN